MKISLVIPMYNEEKIIKDTAIQVHTYMTKTFGAGNFEVLFSNDGSLDASAKIIEELSLDGIRVVGYEKNQGKGCAVRDGMLKACGDIIMFTDADLAYGTDVVGLFYDHFESNPNTQILIGSRNIGNDGYEGYTLIRKIMSKTYIKVLCFVGGFRLTDSQCGCKAFRSDAARKIFSLCSVNGFAFDFEAIMIADKMGISISEAPVKIINHRESKVNVIKDTLKMLGDLRRIKKRVKKLDISR